MGGRNEQMGNSLDCGRANDWPRMVPNRIPKTNFNRLHIKIFNCYQMHATIRITIRHAEKCIYDVISSYLSIQRGSGIAERRVNESKIK